MSGALRGCTEENVITMLVWNEEHAVTLASIITPALFSTRHFQRIARSAIEYIETYKKPPQYHIRDLLEKDLTANDGKYIDNALVEMEKWQVNIHATYVLAELDKFIRVQQRKIALGMAWEALDQGDEAKADDVLWQRTVVRQNTPGVWLHDTDLSFMTQNEGDYFSSGIRALDEKGVTPARGTMTMFIAPKKFGKSWWCVSVGKAGVVNKHNVLHITLENSERLTKRRYVQAFFSMTKRQVQSVNLTTFIRDPEDRNKFEIDTETLQHPIALTEDNASVIKQRLRSLENRPKLLIKHFPSGTLTVAQLNMYLDMLKYEYSFIPDLMLVDYPDLMSINRSDNFRLDLGRVFVELRGIAEDRDIALCCPTQGNRKSDDAKIVNSSMVAEDFSKAGTADTILTGNRTPQERERGLARILVDASRDEEDQFIALITQSYVTGQFCTDSVLMNIPYVRREYARITNIKQDNHVAEELDEADHGA